MIYTLESPSGVLAVFQEVCDFMAVTIGGAGTVEMTKKDARKVWKALTLAQWQWNG